MSGTSDKSKSVANVDIVLDKSHFLQIIQLRALKVPKSACHEVTKLLRGHIFERPRQRSVLIDPEHPDSTRLVLLHPDIAGEELNGLPKDKLEVLLEKGFTHSVPHEVTLDYSYWSADDVLRRLLPSHLEVPTSFETIGQVAHVNLRDELLPYKSIIGSVLLDKNRPRIGVVVNKVGSIENEFRVPQLEVIAGDSACLETAVKQHGALFQLNYAQVYWNSRLEREHDRLAGIIAPAGKSVASGGKKKAGKQTSDSTHPPSATTSASLPCGGHSSASAPAGVVVVCDMFAGVGPFAIPLAMAGCTVFANDLNPASVRYMALNAVRNKVAERVKCYNLDAREFMRALVAEQPAAAAGAAQADRRGGGGGGGGNSVAEDACRAAMDVCAGVHNGAVPQPWQHFDHVIMNLPASALEFLDVFKGLLSRSLWRGGMPFIHCYCFARAGESNEDIVKKAEVFLGGVISEPSVWNVRDVAPNKIMLCLSFKLPEHIAFPESTSNMPVNDAGLGNGNDLLQVANKRSKQGHDISHVPG